MTNMYSLTKAYEEVQALAENGEDVTDTLLSLEGDIEVKAENTHKVIKMFSGYNLSIDEEIKRLQEIKSHLMRGAWIEIVKLLRPLLIPGVAPHARCVD